jgi:hypothetical protein
VRDNRLREDRVASMAVNKDSVSVSSESDIPT